MRPSSSGVINLLRVARTECAGSVAFAAVATSAGEGIAGMEVFTFPQGETAETLSGEVVAELVRQAALDPEYAHGGVFVRGVPLRDGLTLAVAPLRGARTDGMLGVVGLDDQGFDQEQLELLQRLSDRLARHLRALGDVDAIVATQSESEATVMDGPLEGVRMGAPLQSNAAAPATNGAGAHDEGPQPRLDPVLTSAPPHPTAPAPGPPPASRSDAWAPLDTVTGLLSLGQFFSRTGRLLASESRATSALALVLVEVPDDATASVVGRALSTRLRHSDPLVRIEPDLFAAAVLLFPGSTRGDVVEERLAGAVRAALEWLTPVRTTHVLADPADRRDVDELVREAITRLGR